MCWIKSTIIIIVILFHYGGCIHSFKCIVFYVEHLGMGAVVCARKRGMMFVVVVVAIDDGTLVPVFW
jgi:hypothetical protein